jgi:hypothetical protein
MTDSPNRKERVRQQAYHIWLEEGRPEGRDKEHWEQAEKLVDRVDELAKEDERGTASAVGPVPGP